MTDLLSCPLCHSKNVLAGTCYAADSTVQEPAARCDDCGCRATERAWQSRTLAQPEQEPVAWTYRIQHRDDEWVEEVAFQQPDFSVQDLTPLYAAQPPAAPVDPKPDWCQGADAVCHHPACACVVETGPVTVNEYEGSMYELVREQAPLDWKQDQAETSRLKPSAPVEQTCPGGIDPGFEECPKCGATDEEECRAPLPSSSAVIDDDELTGWARSWHWNDCLDDKPVDPSIYFRDMRMLKAFIEYQGRAIPTEPQEAPEPTARDVIAWLEKRQGISWKSTIDDINCALSSIALSLSRPHGN
jgi:hypothetical protein